MVIQRSAYSRKPIDLAASSAAAAWRRAAAMVKSAEHLSTGNDSA
jgi:hypothetical protein